MGRASELLAVLLASVFTFMDCFYTIKSVQGIVCDGTPVVCHPIWYWEEIGTNTGIVFLLFSLLTFRYAYPLYVGSEKGLMARKALVLAIISQFSKLAVFLTLASAAEYGILVSSIDPGIQAWVTMEIVAKKRSSFWKLEDELPEKTSTNTSQNKSNNLGSRTSSGLASSSYTFAGQATSSAPYPAFISLPNNNAIAEPSHGNDCYKPLLTIDE